MVPHADIEVSVEIPAKARFWTPTPEDLPEPGEMGAIGGYFHDTWYFGEVAVSAAVYTVAEELRTIELVDVLAKDPIAFEMVVAAVEWGDLGALPPGLADSDAMTALHELIGGDGIYSASTYQGVDFGVAGLVNVLNAVGLITAASCRGHHYPDRRPWADRPVVYFAADRGAMEQLAPSVEQSGCGFMIDSERPSLMVIEAPSVTCTIRLAQLLLEAR